MSTQPPTAPATLADRDLRQREIVPPEALAKVRAIVIGAGAIGRQATLQLAAMGVPSLVLIDDDTVDYVNLAPQGFYESEIGLLKVNAVADNVRRINPRIALETFPERFRRSTAAALALGQHSTTDVVFSCVDSIETRRMIFESVRDRAALFLDARMSAEVIRVLAVSNDEEKAYYPTTLFTEAEAFVGSCTAKSTIYTASIAAGLQVAPLARFLRGIPLEADVLLNLLSMDLIVQSAEDAP